MFLDFLKTLPLPKPLSKRYVFFLYCMALATLLCLDSVLGFYFPILLEKTFGSNFAAGLIIGLANIVALICDFVFPEFLKSKTWKFLFVGAVVFQFGVPGSIMLGTALSVFSMFIVAAVFWNIYWELMSFSWQSFVVSNEKKDDYSKDWSVYMLIGSFAAIIGPIIGSQMINQNQLGVNITMMALELLTVISTLVLISFSPKHHEVQPLLTRKHIKLNILKEFHLFEILSLRILPVLTLGTLHAIFISSIFTFGGLLGLELLGNIKLEWLLLFMFNVPAIFISLFLARLTVPKYKKLIAQLSTIAAGLCLIALFWTGGRPELVIVLFFLTSLFASTASIFNNAVFTDLSRRSGGEKLYINGLERMNDSVGYFIGPIVFGFLADKLGFLNMYTILGIVLVVGSAILVIVTPRKILIPHKEMAEVV